VSKSLGIKPDDFIIGSCGRLVDEHKRFSDLIRALSLVRRQYQNAKLLIVGKGPDEPMLRNLAVELGVSDNVLFTGYQSETRPYYEVMDVFALASAHEAFGLVLVEAMYADLPIVATRVGGIPMVVKDGETGFLVEPKAPAELADRFMELIKNTALRKSMGLRGHERAVAHFGAERYVREFDELYQRLANHRIRL
jgi:glycosyltransferase involved in cell wall biosynthesis